MISITRALGAMSRHALGCCALPLIAAAVLPMTALAQAFPTAPIKLVVPFAPAGGTDAVARAVAQSLSKQLGQPVVVENRPGAAGALGAMNVVRAKPDGYTLLLGSNGPIAVSPGLDPKLPYDPARDLVAVASIAAVPFLLAANRDLPANTMSELLELARSKPGTINFASPGTGTTNHLVGELLNTMAKVNMVHIPYKGAAPAMNDVAGGTVQFMSGDISTLLPMIQAGRLKALAVTGAARSPLIESVPTVAESGVPGFEANGWFGLFAPKDVPKNVVGKLSGAMKAVLADPEVVERVSALGGTTMWLSPEAFADFAGKERAKWKKVIDANQIKPGE